jgi:hypothetical protein
MRVRIKKWLYRHGFLARLAATVSAMRWFAQELEAIEK